MLRQPDILREGLHVLLDQDYLPARPIVGRHNLCLDQRMHHRAVRDCRGPDNRPCRRADLTQTGRNGAPSHLQPAHYRQRDHLRHVRGRRAYFHAAHPPAMVPGRARDHDREIRHRHDPHCARARRRHNLFRLLEERMGAGRWEGLFRFINSNPFHTGFPHNTYYINFDTIENLRAII